VPPLDRLLVRQISSGFLSQDERIEMYVMQRYLRPEVLHAAGILSADDWCAQFTEQITAIEMSSTTGFKVRTPTAKFCHLPELLRMWHTASDVKTASNLNLPVPRLAPRVEDGARAPSVLPVPATAHQEAFISERVERAEAVATRTVEPTEDNMLKISSDGRTSAMDARLSYEDLVPDLEEPTKIDQAADTIPGGASTTLRSRRRNISTGSTIAGSTVRSATGHQSRLRTNSSTARPRPSQRWNGSNRTASKPGA
jgi:hypothetical protein